MAWGLLIPWAAQIAYAQQVQVNRSNKTIEVTVSASVQVDPDIAKIEVGYHNYGRTQQIAFDDNVRIANQIIKALLDAGVSKDSIETHSLRLGRVSEDDTKNWSPDLKKERQFEAHQSWTIRIAVPEAQKIVDLAVSSGANEVEDVDWMVADTTALEAKANAAALAKARTLAQQMAKELGAKVGELLYASNTRKEILFLSRAFSTSTVTTRREPKLQLYLRKVEREATVHAVFALE